MHLTSDVIDLYAKLFQNTVGKMSCSLDKLETIFSSKKYRIQLFVSICHNSVAILCIPLLRNELPWWHMLHMYGNMATIFQVLLLAA